MFTFTLGAVVLVLFVFGVLRDRRSFSNAILLGMGLALIALGTAARLAHTPDRPARALLLAVVLLVALGPFVVAGFLIQNGITMARREGARPANLLSLLTGMAIFAVIALAIAAERTESTELSLFSTVTALLFGYMSFLLVSYVIYAWVYGRTTVHRDAQYIIVLGSGLKDGGRVPPLLASRLDRGWAVYRKVATRGKVTPALIVSGGKGTDERISEAEAMAAYLTDRGFPADRLIREDRSRTTEENLIFSKAIMDRGGMPGYRCIVVTSNYHVFRAAILARRIGVNGQVTGARTAGYYWPSAMLREFAAVFWSYRAVNFAICALIVALPLAYAHRHGLG